jgi:glutamate-1-semialdehyde 2,1-aminomutase
MIYSNSEALFRRAQESIPGGVNSPVRAFRAVGGQPIFIERADGAYLYDVDGNRYIDYIGSWGPMLFGHRPPFVLDALRSVLDIGTSFGAPTEREILMAERIRQLKPSMEMVRLVSSGTEATMSALRVARGFTGRDLTIKFEGCYHGHVDSLLVKAGSGMATFGLPDSAGVPKAFADTTLALPYNDLDPVRDAFRLQGNQIAAVILEPVVGNAGCLPPEPGFLEGLRELCHQHGALLIFDEVMTGFRLSPGGAQRRFGVQPDLTTIGKVIGGGLPIAAYGGRRDIMTKVAPVGPIYQAGTLSGNPLAVTAGLAMLDQILAHPETYDRLESLGAQLTNQPLPGVTTNRVGSMWTWFFCDGPVRNYEDAKRAHTHRFRDFFQHMLSQGIYLPPSQFEAGFISAAHSEEDIERTTVAAQSFFSAE